MAASLGLQQGPDRMEVRDLEIRYPDPWPRRLLVAGGGLLGLMLCILHMSGAGVTPVLLIPSIPAYSRYANACC